MEFSKEQQNMHYGWIRFYSFSAFVGSIILFNMLLESETLPDDIFGTFILCFIGICLFFSASIFICLCCELFTYARKQKQYFSEEGQLEVTIYRNHIFPLYSHIEGSIKRKYLIDEIKSIRVFLTHITIKGKIQYERYDSPVVFENKECKKSIIKKVRIPRNFTNEHLITKLDIEKYNENAQMHCGF